MSSATPKFERIAFETEGDFEPVEHLQRIDPRFERSVLVAEDGRLSSEHVEERARMRAPLKLKAALSQGKFRYELRGRGLLRACDVRREEK